MKRLLVSIIIGSFFIGNQLHADDKIHEDWVQADRNFLREVINKLKQQPLEIDVVLLTSDKTKEKLGFGYDYIAGSNGKGYVSIFYQFVYYNNQLVSFKLNPEMPDNKKLIPIYKKIYEGIFDFDLKNQVLPYYYDLAKVDSTLPGLQSNIEISKEMKFYMTPYSGILYGDRGGYANSLTINRKHFLTIAAELNANNCLILLYSINPASRLTAFEHYLLNIDKFTKEEKEIIERRMHIVFDELPSIKTMYGCMVTDVRSRDRVNSLVEKAKNP